MSATKENTEALFIPDDTKDIETNRVNEKIIMEENTTIIKRNTFGDSFILNSATNGILGTSELGASNRVLTTLMIVNPGDTFRERFRDDTFENASTTADWGDVSGTLVMTNAEVAVSEEIALNDGTVSFATISVDISSGSASDLSYELTADGGSNWENVTVDTEHTFSDTGVDLRFRITATGNVTVTLVKVSYR